MGNENKKIEEKSERIGEDSLQQKSHTQVFSTLYIKELILNPINYNNMSWTM